MTKRKQIGEQLWLDFYTELDRHAIFIRREKFRSIDELTRKILWDELFTNMEAKIRLSISDPLYLKQNME